MITEWHTINDTGLKIDCPDCGTQATYRIAMSNDGKTGLIIYCENCEYTIIFVRADGSLQSPNKTTTLT